MIRLHLQDKTNLYPNGCITIKYEISFIGGGKK